MARDRSRRRDDKSPGREAKRKSPARKEPRTDAKEDSNGKKNKDQREPKLELKEAKISKEAKDLRDDHRQSRREKETKVAKEVKDVKDTKIAKDTRNPKDSKEAKETKDVREPKVAKDASKEAKDSRESRPTKDSRPAREEKPARERRENDRDRKEIEERKEVLRKRMEELKNHKDEELLVGTDAAREDIDEALKLAMQDRDRALKAVATATSSSTPAASSDAPASRPTSSGAGLARRNTERAVAARANSGVTAVSDLRDVSLGGSISDSLSGISSSGSTLSSGAKKQVKDGSGKKRRKSANSDNDDDDKKRRREDVGLRHASGFSQAKGSSVPSSRGPVAYGPAPHPSSGAIVPLAEKVKGLLDKRLQSSLAEDTLRLKQAVEASKPAGKAFEDEGKESVLRMPPRLHENLLCPENEQKLLKLTGLESCALNEDGLVAIRASSKQGLAKALKKLRRVAYHCQWGCSRAKVGQMLNGPPAKPLNSMVVRLAATSSRLQTHESKLTHKVRKLRVGTQAGACQVVVDGVPGLSRKHCTITFEPEKGACYVQDLSTNGTYLNGRRLPRPPYRNLSDARVRCFHGDELFFRLRSEEAEELGYLINLVELS